MTHAESLRRLALSRLQEQSETTGSFTLSDTTGSLGTFSGVISDTSLSEFMAGGELDDRSITVVAEANQFTDAEVTPTTGMTLTHAGLKYVVESMPGRHSDASSFTLRCVLPMKPKR